MRMMKKVTAVALASCMAVSLAACGSSSSGTTTAAAEGDATEAAGNEAAEGEATEAAEEAAGGEVANKDKPLVWFNRQPSNSSTGELDMTALNFN